MRNYRIGSLTVRARMLLLFLTALAAMAAVSGAGLLGMQAASDSEQVLATRHLPAVSAVGDLRAAVGNLRRFEKDMFLHTGNPDSIDKYKARWVTSMAAARSHTTRIEPLLDPGNRDALVRIGAGLDAYAKGFGSIQEKLLLGAYGDSVVANEAMEPLKGEIRRLDEQLDALTASIRTSAETQQSEMVALHRRLTALCAVVLTGAALVLMAVAWTITRSITQPLDRANTALAQLAGGDLTHTIEAKGNDELSRMMLGLAQTQASLRGLVEVIQDHARNVASASGQIAVGNSDLSVRTEQQAARLQQTAASMEQLTDTVRQGATHAQAVNQLAQQTSGAAERGAEVVSRVVQTMAEIQSSSREIADITNVINSIAFQTNILALNAAVEAARAGEQGRGFAVVATEVRTLAHRSGEAARQIKSLIAASVERVEAEHQLVKTAGGTLSEVFQQVRSMSGLVGDISSATEEQRRGIEQVSEAVGRLDQSTQQNAALVEESAAAAESLRSLSRQLSEAAAAFRLRREEAA